MFSFFSPQFPQKVYSFSARIYPHSVQTPPVNFTWNLPWRDPHGLNAEFRLRVPKEWVRNGSFINLTMNNANIPPQRSGSSNANYNTHIRVDLHVWTGPLTSNSHLIDKFQQTVIQYQATKCVKMLSGSISQISVYHKGREGQPFGNQAPPTQQNLYEMAGLITQASRVPSVFKVEKSNAGKITLEFDDFRWPQRWPQFTVNFPLQRWINDDFSPLSHEKNTRKNPGNPQFWWLMVKLHIGL